MEECFENDFQLLQAENHTQNTPPQVMSEHERLQRNRVRTKIKTVFSKTQGLTGKENGLKQPLAHQLLYVLQENTA